MSRVVFTCRHANSDKSARGARRPRSFAPTCGALPRSARTNRAKAASPAEMEPRRSVRAEAKATELTVNPKAAEVAAPAKPKPKLSKQKAADVPPDTWEFPIEGSAIEVEVESASGGTVWEKATVIAVLIDGTFQAQIKTKARPPC